ncbi:MAG TPA: hypothetical protein VGH28_14310 [Polyangiaceae bacterium]|jgi:hypothetical protein
MLLRRLAPAVSGALLGVVVAAAIVTSGPSASARSDYDSAYGYDRTWNAALRMVRVDMGFKITEQDATNGYLMFEYKSPENTKATPGSIELVRSPDGPVRVVVQLAQMPRYHEQLMVDELVKKMRREYGDPPDPRPAPPKQDPPADAGEDG